MKLVIVESPTKARTISRFLGSGFVVESSFGHVRDLPKSKLGIDVEGTFEPTYVTPPKSKKTLANLKTKAKKAESVILATDEDREGEAIAWHIAEHLKLGDKAERIVFHEITKDAIDEALKNPRHIDKKLVDAQQARRVLDRLVGYTLSPLLWKKIMRGLSAGRVQSVAVRLVVEREREIVAFVPQEFFSLDALLKTNAGQEFSASLWKKDSKTYKPDSIQKKDEVDSIVSSLSKASWAVGSITSKKTKRNPSPPFTTSTLQQAASSRLGFSARQTMRLAQQLYEGIHVGSGEEGLITYMRTDSVNLSQSSRTTAEKYISETFGVTYAHPRTFKTKTSGAQEAHEAIRPTSPSRTPDAVQKYLDPRQYKLYKLIWERFVASQMSPAIFSATTAEIETGTPYLFRSSGLQLEFDGYLKVWRAQTKEALLPELKEKEQLSLKKLLPERHETQPPPRYSEATLIKALEENGIGRPSTYAPTMGTIQDRGYVEKDDNRRLRPTETAKVVTDFLIEHFPKIVDLSFTATMEEDLDSIAEGEKDWLPLIKNFYQELEPEVKKKEKTIERRDVTAVKELGTDPETGRPVTVRIGRYGPYIQKGEKEDAEKPVFAGVPKGTVIDELNLERALIFFNLPRTLGHTKEGEEIKVNIGRYGPYVQIGKVFASLGEADPFTVTREEAEKIFEENKKSGGKKVLKEFEGSELRVQTGRYGPYVTDGTINATLPKDSDPEKVTLEEAQEMIEKKKLNPGRGRGRKKKK